MCTLPFSVRHRGMRLHSTILPFALVALGGCMRAGSPIATGRMAHCPPPDERRDTYFDRDAAPTAQLLSGRYRLTWIADTGRGRGRMAETTLLLEPSPREPTHVVQGALVDTTPAQMAALEAVGMHRARELATRSDSNPPFVARLLADRVFRFHGLGGTQPGDGPFAEIIVEEYRGPRDWRGRWRSYWYFSGDRTGGWVCARRIG